jgi:TPR repeat protein
LHDPLLRAQPPLRLLNEAAVDAPRHKALFYYQASAELGNAFAQHNLGVMYALGQGVEQSMDLALKHYQEAAEQGDAQAQYAAGMLLNAGVDVPQDELGALLWLEMAAAQDHPGAVHQLGLLQAQGASAQPDYSRQRVAYQQAVDRGDPNAAFNLGLLYAQGLGTAPDLALATKYYRHAANAGLVPALNNLAVLTLGALEGLTNTPTFLDENTRQALKDLHEAADQDDAYAHFNLGQLHLHGICLPCSPEQAKLHFERAMEMGHTPAMLQLAQLYGQGLGCKADAAQAWGAGGGGVTMGSKCLDVFGQNATVGAPLDVWGCNGEANQAWRAGAGELASGISAYTTCAGLCAYGA